LDTFGFLTTFYWWLIVGFFDGKLLNWRREWDSNPRNPLRGLLEFQSSAFDRSAISPLNHLRELSRPYLMTAVRRQAPRQVKNGGE
jgi:hypothetical protein